MIPANADTVRRTFSSFEGIISSPERNLLAPIVAIMVHVLLPIGTPKTIDWQIWDGNNHSFTLPWSVTWRASWLVGVCNTCWLVIEWSCCDVSVRCHPQLQLHLSASADVHVAPGRYSHLTWFPFGLLCPLTGWPHFLQWGGLVTVVGMLLFRVFSLWWRGNRW